MFSCARLYACQWTCIDYCNCSVNGQSMSVTPMSHSLEKVFAHFMKIEIKLEISIPMCNCAAGKKWKRSVAWFPSYRAKCVANVERKFSRKRTLLR